MTEDDQKSESTAISAVGDAANSVASIFSNVPAPLQKSFFKAASRLLGSAVDVPAAWLEGIADGIRSRTEARRLITMETAKNIAVAMPTDDDLSRRAFARNASKLLGEQANLDDVVRIAADELEKAPEPIETPAKGEIEDDWLNVFATEAATRSSDEMKQAFARILAGEVKAPGTFSIRAVRTLSTIDRETAERFRILCSLCITRFPDDDARAQWPTDDIQSGNGLTKYGFTYASFNRLVEHGLVNTDLRSYISIGLFVQHRIPLFYLDKPFFLLPTEGESKDDPRLIGISLTSLGRELRKIVELKNEQKYTNDLVEYFAKKKLLMIFAEEQRQADGSIRYASKKP